MSLHLFFFILLLIKVLGCAPQEHTILASHSSVTGCTVGAYKVQTEPFNGCSGWRSCGAGHYCVDGVRLDCPPGSYGASEILSNPTCNGVCSAGYWCPSRSTSHTQNKCGNYTHYCPTGSATPLLAPDGFYTTNDDNGIVNDVETRSSISICPIGHYCKDGILALCPAGTFGASKGLRTSACSGGCASGWYCPEGSTSETQAPCGANPVYYCPAGSGRRAPVTEAYYAASYVQAGSDDALDGGYSEQKSCPAGSYCVDGVKTSCAAGRYGSRALETNASCSGECIAGYYCPAGSISPKQRPCGDISVYCPVASTEPLVVSVGHYTFSHLNKALFDAPEFNNYANVSHRHYHKAQRQTGQRLCEVGYFCKGDGFKLPCAAGRYGSRGGEDSPQCSGPCAEGFYCPNAGSSTPTEDRCDDVSTFCLTGSILPQIVTAGYYSLLGASISGLAGRAFEHKCEPGYYCFGGVRMSCPRGVFGGSYGLTNESCSGLCSEGYYCPVGSISSTEIECGNHNLYCPGHGNWRPTRVSPGYFTVGGNLSTRTGQQIAPTGSYAEDGLQHMCRAGYFGASSGLSLATCSGPCSVQGYYCPLGSTSPTMRVCGGDEFICPSKSTAPIKVLEGHYTTDYAHEGCKPGYFRNWTLSLDPTHHTSTYNSSLLADPTMSGEPLSLLPSFATTPSCEPCPDGTFKSVKGDSFSLCRPCNNTQQNKLATSTDDRTTCECEKRVSDPENYLYHFNVISGKCIQYTLDDFLLVDSSVWAMNTSLTRFRQTECEAGYYCIDGERFICSAGRYGDRPRETRSSCSGDCAPGYFCPAGSTSAFQNVCGARDRICPAGSSSPLPVGAGSYTDVDASALLQVSLYTCEPGYYCPGDGARYECPSGFYGDTPGLSSEACSGLCESGYYCGSSSSTSTQHRCGNATVYCPRGSSYPRTVHAGFYTINTGDDASAEQLWDSSNSSRSAEIPCEPGYYCSGGVKQPCPPGTFGWRYGMTSIGDCQLCAKGHYCPSYLQPQPDAPGHTVWPGKPHTMADELECGSVGFYCPAGSFFPAVVGSGNFSTGGDSTNRTRTGQEICVPGYFCSNGIALSCPKGKYGSASGLSQQVCTDWCPPAKYCPEGTADPLPCPHNHYAQGATWLCSECPAPRSTELTCQDKRSCCFME